MEEPQPLQSQRGATLMEVLVALVVLSVGLLGVAGLQTTGINASNSAFYKTQASVLAADMAERIRANPRADYATVEDGFDTGNSVIPSNPNCLTSNSGCTADQMVDYDLYQWNQLLRGDEQSGALPVLPDARGVISVGNNGEMIVSVLWRERRISDSTQTAQCSVDNQPDGIVCVEMRFR